MAGVQRLFVVEEIELPDIVDGIAEDMKYELRIDDGKVSFTEVSKYLYDMWIIGYDADAVVYLRRDGSAEYLETECHMDIIVREMENILKDYGIELV